MNVIVDPQGSQLPQSARRVLAHAWVAAGFKTRAEQEAAWAQGFRFARTDAAAEQEFEVELVRTIRTKVRVKAASAAEIKRRIADQGDSYADDIWHDGADDCDGVRCAAVRPLR